MLFSAHFEKALYSIDHTFILAALKSYDFDPGFIQWIKIKTFLNNAGSCVMKGVSQQDIFYSKGGYAKAILYQQICSFQH